MFVRRHYAFQLSLNSLYNSPAYLTAPISKEIGRRLPAWRPYNCYALIELGGKTSDEQAVIFICLLYNNSSNVFLLAKTGNIVK